MRSAWLLYISLACLSTHALRPSVSRRSTVSLLTKESADETIPLRWKGPAYPDNAARRKRRDAAAEKMAMGVEAQHSVSTAAGSMRRFAENHQPSEVEGRVVPTGTGSSTVGQDAVPESNVQQVLQRIKDAGIAGIVSYGVVQLAFFGASIPACILGYYQAAGHWPDLTSAEDQAELAAGAVAFLGLSRLLIPVRIALALGLAQGVQTNVIDRFRRGGAATTSEAPPSRSFGGPSMLPTDSSQAPGALTSSKCFYCHGSRQIPCGHCLASGELTFLDETGARVTQPCPNCAATSTVKCINCQGSGVMIMDT